MGEIQTPAVRELLAHNECRTGSTFTWGACVALLEAAILAERERCANIADQHAVAAEKQAALQQDQMVHDAMIMASDFCELLACAIRSTDEE